MFFFRPKALIIAICIQERTGSHLAPGTNVVYLVYYPHSQHLFATTIKQAHKDFMLRVFGSTFGCSRVVELSLSGKDLPSIATLLINRHSQGPYTAFRLGQHDSNPLARNPKKRLSAPTAEPGPAAKRNKLVIEDTAEVNARAKINEETFGSYPQPKLEKIHFRLQTRFKGNDRYDVDGVFGCKVCSKMFFYMCILELCPPPPPRICCLHLFTVDILLVNQYYGDGVGILGCIRRDLGN